MLTSVQLDRFCRPPHVKENFSIRMLYGTCNPDAFAVVNCIGNGLVTKALSRTGLFLVFLL